MTHSQVIFGFMNIGLLTESLKEEILQWTKQPHAFRKKNKPGEIVALFLLMTSNHHVSNLYGRTGHPTAEFQIVPHHFYILEHLF